MILQSLVSYYDAVADKGEIAAEGWSAAKVSLAMEISGQGEILGFVSMMQLPEGGKKEIARTMKVPEQVKRTSGIMGNFLCDNAQYILGMSTKKSDDPERQKKQAEQCFLESKRLHHEILDGVQSEPAQAVLRFFDSWNPKEAYEHPLITDKTVMDLMMKGGNTVFLYQGRFLHEFPEIRRAWEAYREKAGQNEMKARCLVTGQIAPIAVVHPPIKSVMGAQSSGAALVSYNAPAFCSYDHEQGMNAPVSRTAAFKYGTALNFLTARKENVQRIADTTVVFWSQSANHEEEDLFGDCVDSQDYLTDMDLKNVVSQVAKGKKVNFREENLDPDDGFCVLGLAPNAGRISVRLFLQGTFGSMLGNLEKHYDRLDIVKPPFKGNMSLGIWFLLNETANQNSKNKMPPSPMAGAVLTSVLTDQRYPDALFQDIIIRIRAERYINWRKAAIIKAWLLKNGNVRVKEAATVELNEQSSYLPYVLGREFAVLERIQQESVRTQGEPTPAADGKDKKGGATPPKSPIRDRYFTSASTTPAAIFPVIMHLSQHHQKKLSDSARVWYDKLLTELQSRIHEELPRHLTLQEQGAFYLGYYHQKQAFFAKKETKEEAENE